MFHILFLFSELLPMWNIDFNNKTKNVTLGVQIMKIKFLLKFF
jgi:hypothetical protein